MGGTASVPSDESYLKTGRKMGRHGGRPSLTNLKIVLIVLVLELDC
jgi:hypothetical protein